MCARLHREDGRILRSDATLVDPHPSLLRRLRACYRKLLVASRADRRGARIVIAAAVLFDIDGTLIDSNYLHVDAWSLALSELGPPVDDWRIHAAIGMDSSKLLESLLGDDAEALGEKASAAHSERYSHLSHELRPFARARELLFAAAENGLRVVLA